jgi:anti-sigma B factor antagonist
MSLTTTTRYVGGVTILDISGRIVLGEESSALREQIHGLLSQGKKQILLNLVAVDSIDSVGLGTLVGAFATLRNKGGELKLCNLPNKVADVMQMTKLYTVFDIAKDEEDGVKSFAKSNSAATA